MTLPTKDVGNTKERRAEFRKTVRIKLNNEGLSRTEYNKIKTRFITSDMTVEDYISLRFSFGEVRWEGDKLVSTRRPYRR